MNDRSTSLAEPAKPARRDPVTRAERLLGEQNRLLELVATDAPLATVLDSLARFIESESTGLVCSVLLLSGRRLRHGAGPSLPEAYRAAIDGVTIGPDIGSCGHAAYTGNEALAVDIATDPRWKDYRELALGHGLRSCWSTAIHARSGEVLGTFAMYRHVPYEPTQHDRELVEVATRIAAIAIERSRTDQALKEQAAALLAADRRKDEFLAMLAHELRGPLAPILNASELVTRVAPAGTPISRAAGIVERQARHLMRLVDDLLDVSRITRGKISLQPVTTTVGDIVARALEMTRPLAETAGVTLVAPSDPASERLAIDADPVRLTQALFNVVSNAIKFTPRGGRIEVDVREADAGASIVVRDTGVGIAPELLASIFDLFQQGEQALDRSRGGLGIGLTVARGLIEMHGGRITARSDGVGRGTEISMWLPLSANVDPLATAASSLAVPTAARRVLIVDDNIDGAEMLAIGLARPGLEVRVAHDGPAALALALDWHPEVVVLDIGLPGMDGYEVARRLRAMEGGEKALVVGVTGYGDESHREQSRRAGFDLHLVKPVAILDLARAMSEARSTIAAPRAQR